MKRFVEGSDRGQSALFPECLEDWICEENPVRGPSNIAELGNACYRLAKGLRNDEKRVET